MMPILDWPWHTRLDGLYFLHEFSNSPYPVDELPCAKVHCQPLDNRQVSMALRGRDPASGTFCPGFTVWISLRGAGADVRAGGRLTRGSPI